MKVRNIMFSGFAAAILMGTANAATTPFEIASKAYVDAQVRGATSNVGDTIGDMTTLQNGEGSNIGDGTDNVVEALNDLDDAINTKQNEADSNVSGTLREGTHLTAGHGVATNLINLDTALGAVETKVGNESVANQIDNKLGELGTNETTGADNTVADALAGKVDKSAVATSIGSKDNASNDKWASEKAVADAIAGVTGNIGSIQQQIDEVVGDLGQNATTGKENTVEQALALKQDKSDSTTGSGTYNYIASSSSAVATNLGTLDTNLKRVDDAVGSYDSTTGTGTGLAKDVADIQSALTDQTTGLTPRVEALEETVGDATDGLVKDVADLQTNKADAADVYTKTEMNSLLGAKIDKPAGNECTAGSGHCVLSMDSNGNLLWVDVTNPWTVESGSSSEETPTEP